MSPLEITAIRHRPLSALLVGATGRHVLRVVTAFESRRIQTFRAEDIHDACEKIPLEMPHVVLALLPATPAEREELADRALAVGALVVHADPLLDDEAMRDLLEQVVAAALERRARQDAAELAVEATDLPSQEELDAAVLEEGWGD